MGKEDGVWINGTSKKRLDMGLDPTRFLQSQRQLAYASCLVTSFPDIIHDAQNRALMVLMHHSITNEKTTKNKQNHLLDHLIKHLKIFQKEG